MSDKKHLLVVDDELLIRDLLYDHFAACDYAISLADNGGTALTLLGKEKFDAVILDLKMPDMDGLELASLIREKEGNVPIIIITGYPSIESAVEALRRRYFDYFVKPFNMKKLEKAVQAAVREHAATDREAEEALRG
jgi:DNA-binding NtrC family response regulator